MTAKIYKLYENPPKEIDPLQVFEDHHGHAETNIGRGVVLSRKFSHDEPIDILDHMIHHEFKNEIALVSSFGTESAVLLDLLAQVNKDTPVIFLNTGKHFAQTLTYRRKLVAELGLTNVTDIKPKAQEIGQQDPKSDLWKTNTDACCDLRKVRPMDHATKQYEALITGRKQYHGGDREGLPVVEFTDPHFKVNPIVRWDNTTVQAQFDERGLLKHPLLDQGYASVGCWPCTQPTAAGEDVRAGRWRGQDKTECGIHLGRTVDPK